MICGAIKNIFFKSFYGGIKRAKNTGIQNWRENNKIMIIMTHDTAGQGQLNLNYGDD